MKATHNTPERLILDDTPWFIGIAPARLILAFAGAGLDAASTGGETLWFGPGFAAFCLFVRRVQVILDRPGGSIVIRRQSVFGSSQVEHFLADLSRAEVESATSRSEGRTRTLFSPVLVLDGGLSADRHPVVEAYTNGGGPHRLAEAINAWLPASAAEAQTYGR
ncbi:MULTISPECIES: hypothetical protein [Leisingera]|jgi:hypothetical protein|uniref:hypothetical protein n=1 Tax=Leisingera TaxID=191028 RepID=UPI00114EB593|nr:MULTISPECIES: hypothetical protein [Leisingera]QDI77293.1 hypothetical protein R2C4_16545 [Leisingera aquaemixtae]